MIKLGQTETGATGGRYFNASRYRTEREALENGMWFIAVIGDREEPASEELDVMARDRNEAFAVAKAAMARDYTAGLQVTDLVLA